MRLSWHDCPVVEFADDTEMSRRAAAADEFQRVMGCVEGESWSYFISDEATIYDVWFDDDVDEVTRRVRSHYGYSLKREDFRRPLWRVLDDLERSREPGG
jgi:hypothetical protein